MLSVNRTTLSPAVQICAGTFSSAYLARLILSDATVSSGREMTGQVFEPAADGVAVWQGEYLSQGEPVPVRSIKIDTRQINLKIWHSQELVAYDFSKYTGQKGHDPQGREYKELPGKTMEQFVAQDATGRLVLAVNGHQGNFWTGNTIVWKERRIYFKHVPGVPGNQKQKSGLDGQFYCFVLDRDKEGIRSVILKNSLPQDPTVLADIENAMFGPVLVRHGVTEYHHIKRAVSPEEGMQVTWNPEEKHGSFSAIGRNADGKVLIISTKQAGFLKDFVDYIASAGITDAILLGSSADVQQYLKGARGGEFLRGVPRPGSVTGKPGQVRALGSIIAGFGNIVKGNFVPVPMAVSMTQADALEGSI